MARPTKVTQTFASGISIPFRADSDGGVALSEGETYIQAQVLMCVRPNESDNPFQDLGVGQEAVFQSAADPDWKLVIRRRIERQFEELDRENLARLKKVRFEPGDGNGDLRVVIQYTNLETTTEGEAATVVGFETSRDLRAV